MRPSERLYAIFERVEKTGEVSLSELSEAFQVSEMTIRRDVERLVMEGAVQLNVGKVIRGSSGSYEPPFTIRAERNALQKTAIASAVARSLKDRQTVLLDGGSTGVAVAMEIFHRILTVCTPSLKVANVLAHAPDIQLIITGGNVRRGEESLIGQTAITTLSSFRFDTYVMTVSGISLTHGFTEWNEADAAIKRTALAVSTECVVAADSSKVDRVAFSHVANLSSVSKLITDDGLSKTQRASIVAAGVELEVVKNF
jgi:DeoR/GlpR family transcriptional regulator of sugar metabolism